MLLAGPVVQAKEIADVHFEDSISVPGIDSSLQLNGLGIRYKLFFKIYIAALYLETPAQEVEALLQSNTARRLVMHFLYDEVSEGKLVKGWLDGFRANLISEDFKRLEPRIDRFNRMFETLREGDVVFLDYLPQQGTRVTVKGIDKVLIEGEDFNRALLKIWLGDEPVADELKEALLGK